MIHSPIQVADDAVHKLDQLADLLAPVVDVFCIFVTFPCGILGQVWYLIVSFPDLCHFSYFTRPLTSETILTVKQVCYLRLSVC